MIQSLAPPEYLRKIYLNGDKWVLRMLLAHGLLAVLLAGFYDTWIIGIGVGLCAISMFFAAYLVLPGSLTTRVIAGISLQLFCMLHIYQMHGLAEMHFFYFTSTTALILYQDHRAIWPGVAIIIGQHILFAVLNNSGYQVYFFENPYIRFSKLFFHFSIAAVQAASCCFFAAWLRKNTIEENQLKEALQVRSAELSEKANELELENERKSEELSAARELQVSMMPGSKLEFSNCEVYFQSDTCTELGGDYYDYAQLAPDHCVIAVGDATGHGMKAAIVVATCKSIFQENIKKASIAETFTSISRALENLHIKGFYMGLTLIELRGYTVSIISSGMPPIFHLAGKAANAETMFHNGPFLGFQSARIEYPTSTFNVKNGEGLIVMSDGMMECFDEGRTNILGVNRMASHLSSLQLTKALPDLIDDIFRFKNKFTNYSPVEDDSTVVAIRFKIGDLIEQPQAIEVHTELNVQ